VALLRARFGAEVHQRTVCQEQVGFPLPKPLRGP